MVPQPAFARPSPVETLQQAFLQDIRGQSNPTPSAGSVTPHASTPAPAKPDADSESTPSTVSTSQGGRLAQLPPFSSDVSQLVFADLVDEQLTPPTSSSGLSSQGHTSHLAPYSPPRTNASQHQPSETASSQQNTVDGTLGNQSPSGSPTKDSFPTNIASGHKRTATGEIKTSQNREPEFTSTHSRSASSASNGTNIAEVSSHSRINIYLTC